MISEVLLTVVFGVASDLFSLLPDFSWSVDSSFFEYLISFIQMISYLLPWGTVTLICSLVIALSLFRLVVSIIKTIWDLLPLV